MPNWVYNNLSLTGDADLVNEVKAKLAQPYETNHREFVRNDDGTATFGHTLSVHDEPFSFWNIQSPTDLDAYWGEATEKIELDNFAESYNNAIAKGMDWWHWNVREWGCKWDASNVYLDEPYEANGKLTIGYRFDTPWSPPLEAIAKLAHQYPDLIVSIEYEEEQGWGGNWTFEGDEVTYQEEWDVPDSHAEEMARKDYCWRCDDMDEEDWYDDCPRPDLTEPAENGNVAV